MHESKGGYIEDCYRDDGIYRSGMVGSARWLSLHWRTRLSKPGSKRCTRKTSSASLMRYEAMDC
jgi:hypothetical protein